MARSTDDRANRSGRRDRRNRERDSGDSVRLALDRAVHHAQLALSEGVASARAVLDAVSIGVSGGPAQDHPRLSELAWTLDRVAAALSGEAPSLRAAALSALLAAIDGEVARWEVRSRSDEDARAVLRAFLGLREILWEMGVRPTEAEPNTRRADEHPPRDRERAARERTSRGGQNRGGRHGPRVQRVTIRG